MRVCVFVCVCGCVHVCARACVHVSACFLHFLYFVSFEWVDGLCMYFYYACLCCSFCLCDRYRLDIFYISQLLLSVCICIFFIFFCACVCVCVCVCVFIFTMPYFCLLFHVRVYFPTHTLHWCVYVCVLMHALVHLCVYVFV